MRSDVSTPRSAASTGALTNVTCSSTTSLKTPLSAASCSTETSSSAISPRTSTSRLAATPPASAVKTRPSFSTSGSAGRRSSATTPPAWTFTASGTNSPASARRTERATDDAGLVLRLDRRGAEVRGDDDLVEGEQRRVGARLGREDVEPRPGDRPGREGLREGVLVEQAAAGGVDDPHRRLAQRQLLAPDQPDGLGGLGQVDRDEVALAQQLVERHQPHADLRGARRRDVGVVGDQRGAERRHPLGEQHADAPEADHADRLVGHLDAGPPAALPPPLLERGVRRREVAGAGEQQRDGLLGRADDVARRRVDDHDAPGGRGRHVDVVEADAGPGDDLQPRGRRQRLGVDAGGAADQHRGGVGERRQQRRTVGAVDVAHLDLVAEDGEHGRRELLGDEHDGQRSACT